MKLLILALAMVALAFVRFFLLDAGGEPEDLGSSDTFFAIVKSERIYDQDEADAIYKAKARWPEKLTSESLAECVSIEPFWMSEMLLTEVEVAVLEFNLKLRSLSEEFARAECSALNRALLKGGYQSYRSGGAPISAVEGDLISNTIASNGEWVVEIPLTVAEHPGLAAISGSIERVVQERKQCVFDVIASQAN